MQNSIFIALESSQYLGFKNIYIPYGKMIVFFAFCVYKNIFLISHDVDVTKESAQNNWCGHI